MPVSVPTQTHRPYRINPEQEFHLTSLRKYTYTSPACQQLIQQLQCLPRAFLQKSQLFPIRESSRLSVNRWNWTHRTLNAGSHFFLRRSALDVRCSMFSVKVRGPDAGFGIAKAPIILKTHKSLQKQGITTASSHLSLL